jgi:hypothetical protein
VVSDVSQPSSGLPLQFPQPEAQLGLHAPAVQDVVPCALVHVLPHEPQLLVLFRFVSQPFETSPSQLAHPALQDPTAQLPLEHVPVPLATLHTLPHAPQLAGSVFRFFSHPLA